MVEVVGPAESFRNDCSRFLVSFSTIFHDHLIQGNLRFSDYLQLSCVSVALAVTGMKLCPWSCCAPLNGWPSPCREAITVWEGVIRDKLSANCAKCDLPVARLAHL